MCAPIIARSRIWGRLALVKVCALRRMACTVVMVSVNSTVASVQIKIKVQVRNALRIPPQLSGIVAPLL